MQIEDPQLCARIKELLALYLHPDTDAWELSADGSWKRTGGSVDMQQRLCRMHSAATEPSRSA